MTAIATVPVMTNHDSGTETGTEHSPSRFTAVNGRDSSAPVGNLIPNHHHSEDRGAPVEDSTKSGDRDGRSQSVSSPHSASAPIRYKRRRSESGEPEQDQIADTQNPEKVLTNHPSDLNALPHSNGSVSVSDVETGNPPTSGRSDTNEAPPASNGPWPEYDAQLVHQAQRAQQMDASDVQLVDALQRETQSQESGQGSLSGGRPTPPNMQTASSPVYSSERSGAVQVAKRKRIFSNRTKTGCMTCRRRKKKCDEQHPACEFDQYSHSETCEVGTKELTVGPSGNNCLRGGFLCEGYTSRSTWQKPSGSKAPIPLQSKEGYPEISAQYLPEATQHHDRPSNPTEHADARKMRPVVVEDADRPVSQYNNGSPTGTGSSHPSWSKRNWPTASQPTYALEHPVKDFRDVTTVHELARDGPPKPDYPTVPPIRDISHAAHAKSNVPLFQAPVEQRPLPAPAIDANSPQAQARMALSIEHQISGRSVSTVYETEKDKMIHGQLYRPFDIQLVEERDRCKLALWRFNNACSPVSGLNSKEQNRLLKEVLIPPSSSVVNSPSTGASATRRIGSISQGAVVEAPFSCHYGYNIKIGEDVMISHDCLFVDDCLIQIGAHTWIGPKVTLITSTAHSSMQERKGSQSRYQGAEIIISEDVYLGAGCTIYPGVTLGRGAYIAPGEIVRSHILPYGFQGYRPGYM
ncbi:hypothetical protein N7495_001852 [Penicillium taxi]|uniref:uncharacterized protein n=1 Tax=Penicillium taxi TaxID=168475 RepID=UPI002545259C|nr:uncharacterized protein N7495_001852 [Penicillium taxi]KAJ5909170.1 hypothetical protein N7495_001852 [Penicillium taxi]